VASRASRSTPTGRDLARFVAHVTERGREDIDDVTPADVADFLIALSKAGLGARSRARTLVAVRGCASTWSASAGSMRTHRS